MLVGTCSCSKGIYQCFFTKRQIQVEKISYIDTKQHIQSIPTERQNEIKQWGL